MERLKPNNIVKPEQQAAFRTAGARYKAAEQFYNESPQHFLKEKTTEEWLHLDEAGYYEMEVLADGLYDATKGVFAGSTDREAHKNMNANYEGLTKHIRVMQGLVDEYWDNGLSELFPADTTIWYVKALALAHDWSRFSGINGSLPLQYVDRVSDAQVRRFFPGLPVKEHLHSISMVIDQHADKKPEISEVQHIMKLFDTCGKPEPRNPETFFEKGGGHDMWLKRQENNHALPFTALNPHRKWDDVTKEWDPEERKFIEISVNDYGIPDKSLTWDGYSLIQERSYRKHGIDFVASLHRVTRRVNRDKFIVNNFGKRKEDHQQALAA